MTWLLARDARLQEPRETVIDRCATEVLCNPDIHGGGPLLARGTIYVELGADFDTHAPCRVVRYERNNSWVRRFNIFLNADFSVSVEIQQGRSRAYARLEPLAPDGLGRAALSYSWDAPRQLGLLTLECLSTGRARQTIVDNPPPLPIEDAVALFDPQRTSTGENMLGMALSDSFEPVGPAGAIAAGAMIETEDGPRSVEKLQLGDRVRTAGNGFQPVRWIVRHDMPAVGRFLPVRLRAPYFGLRQDILVAQSEGILISGDHAEYLFGQDAVLIPARELLGHRGVVLDTGAPVLRYHHVLLDMHDCVSLSGAWAESLFVGDLTTRPELLATSRLSELPRGAVPRHGRRFRPAVAGFGARTLLDAIRA